MATWSDAGLAMGIQNATARRLAVPELTTTQLTMTVTGIVPIRRLPAVEARSSAAAHWRWQRC